MTNNTDNMSMEELEALMAEKKHAIENIETAVAIDVMLDRLRDLDVEFDELLSETGNAETFVKSFDEQVRYVIELKQWAYWAKQKWNLNTDSNIERKYKMVVQAIKTHRYELEAMSVSLPVVDKKDESPLASACPSRNKRLKT